MLRPATVQDISHHRITRQHGRIVVVTRYYPRYLPKIKIDEFLPGLAPPKELLHAFKAAEESIGDHDRAFAGIDYESQFPLVPDGLVRLGELAEEARHRHVYLVCHCDLNQYCHRELLFLIAEARFGAAIPTLSHPYATFRARLAGAL